MHNMSNDGISGRTKQSTWEALIFSDAVAQYAASVLHSRSDPAVGNEVRVFQSPLSGKFELRDRFPLPDKHSASSAFLGCPNTASNTASTRTHHAETTRPVRQHDMNYTPHGSSGRTPQGPREALTLSDTVAQSAASALQSRLDPAVRSGVRVFQLPSTGKLEYRSGFHHLPDVPPVFSTSPLRSYPITRPNRPQLRYNFSIYYQNVGGMNSCTDDYRLACSDNSYDAIAISETWLDDRTLSEQVFSSGYEVFRCDRSPRNSAKSSGGGVAIAVRRGLKAQLLDNTQWSNVEQVWVVVELDDRKLFLCTVYIPPDRIRDAALMDAHLLSVMSTLSLSSPVDDVVILGDFNLSGLKWIPLRDGFLRPDVSLSSIPATITNLLDNYSTATLQQINDNTNENHRILDLCFVSCQDIAPFISVAPAPLVKHTPHHPPLHLSIDSKRDLDFVATSTPVYYDYHNADINSILAVLSSINWTSVLDKDDVNVAVQTFSHILGYVIDRHVPKRTLKGPEYLPWQTAQLRRLKTMKRAALRRFSKHRSLLLRDHYFRLNQRYKSMSRHCYATHLVRIQRRLKSNPKSFWQHINQQRKESGLPSSMSLGDDVAMCPEDICQLFAQKFASTYECEVPTIALVTSAANNVPLNGQVIDGISFSDTQILRAAAKLKSSTSAGPDGIPSIMLKQCISELLAPLRHIFRLSLSCGIFPNLWKTAYMFPVHKKGNKRNIDNYRGISALCAASKLFELVVMDPIFFHCKRIISDSQHGFFPRRSTTTNLLDFTSSVLDSMTEGHQTDAIYTDLSAAFDKINHDIAVAKLERMGINGMLLRWFRSYLTGRLSNVTIGEHSSIAFAAHSGIPQGSHLGPLIFLLYFNDCCFSLEGSCLSYADDMKIFQRVKSVEDAQFLQRQLNSFAEWCSMNCMVVNPKKCCIVSFSRKRETIVFNYRLFDEIVPRENCVKDLGVLLDSKLTFKQHVSYIVDKSSRQLGFIFRATKAFEDIYCLKALYCALVRSSLEYCSAVWSPYYMNGVQRIESVQRRFIRFALRRLPWNDPLRLPSYESRCKLINLDTLDVRRNVARALVVADTLTSRMDCPAILQRIGLQASSRNLRHQSFLQIPFRRTNYGSYGSITGLLRVFNRAASTFDFNLSRETIKTRFLRYFR